MAAVKKQGNNPQGYLRPPSLCECGHKFSEHGQPGTTCHVLPYMPEDPVACSCSQFVECVLDDDKWWEWWERGLEIKEESSHLSDERQERKQDDKTKRNVGCCST